MDRLHVAAALFVLTLAALACKASGSAGSMTTAPEPESKAECGSKAWDACNALENANVVKNCSTPDASEGWADVDFQLVAFPAVKGTLRRARLDSVNDCKPGPDWWMGLDHPSPSDADYIELIGYCSTKARTRVFWDELTPKDWLACRGKNGKCANPCVSPDECAKQHKIDAAKYRTFFETVKKTVDAFPP
jgi:hypothetical protein